MRSSAASVLAAPLRRPVLAVAAGLALLAVFVVSTGTAYAVGALTDISVTLSDDDAGDTGNVTVSADLQTALASDGRIVVDFPDTFAFNSGGTTVVSSENLSGTLSVLSIASGGVVTLQRSGGMDTLAGTDIQFTLTNVRNPLTAGSVGPFVLQTTTMGGVLLDIGVLSSVTITPDTDDEAQVTLSDNDAGDVTNVTVAFETESVLPGDGRIRVTFPSGFALNTGAATAVASENISGTLSVVSVSGQTVTLQRSGGTALAAGTDVQLTLTNVRNPLTTGETGDFIIQTLESDSDLIDVFVADGVLIDDDGDDERANRVTICHKGRTITVAWAGWWNGHRGHGDTMGACQQ